MISTALITALMLVGPFEPPPKLPKKPPHPIVKFLNEDLWKLHAAFNQCLSDEAASLCADATPADELEKVSVTFTFTWRF